MTTFAVVRKRIETSDREMRLRNDALDILTNAPNSSADCGQILKVFERVKRPSVYLVSLL
jgi:hypothetical protein